MTIFEELRVTDDESYEFIYSLYDGANPYVLQSGESLMLFAYAENGDTQLFTSTATTTQTSGKYQFILPKVEIAKITCETLCWYKICLIRSSGAKETVETLSPLVKVR